MCTCGRDTCDWHLVAFVGLYINVHSKIGGKKFVGVLAFELGVRRISVEP